MYLSTVAEAAPSTDPVSVEARLAGYRAHTQLAAALHRPCVGGGTIGGYTTHTQLAAALHRPCVGGGTIGGL